MIKHRQIQNWDSFTYLIEDKLLGRSMADTSIFLVDTFSPVVRDHIMNYVLKQYGEQIDNGTDPLSESKDPVDYCTACIKKYRNRFVRNQREYNDGRDCVKRAHYVQLRALSRGEITDDDIVELLCAIEDWRKTVDTPD
jgi:hypothetical protein